MGPRSPQRRRKLPPFKEDSYTSGLNPSDVGTFVNGPPLSAGTEAAVTARYFLFASKHTIARNFTHVK